MSASLNRKLRQAHELLNAGDAARARALVELALREAPRNPDALCLHGVCLVAEGRPREAVPPLARVLEIEPHHGAALEHFGLAHLMLGEPAAARGALASAAALPGAPASVHMRLGIALIELGRVGDATAALERARAMAPEDADCLINLGRALALAGNATAATARLEEALRLKPGHPDAAYNLGVLALARGEPEAARRWFERVLAASPGAADAALAREGLASAALAVGRTSEAIDHLRAALATQPDNARACAVLAGALFDAGELQEAEACARRAAEGGAGAPAFVTLANVDLVSGRLDAALATIEAGYARTRAEILVGMLAYESRQACDWPRWHAAWTEVEPRLARSTELGSPFWLLCEPTTPAQQLDYTRRWARERFGAVKGEPPAARARGARLRVGYLSSDFQEHAVGHLVVEALELHDRERFEIFAYSHGPREDTPLRLRFRAACEHFVDIAREADEAAARRIREDGLDLLVDLKGYTVGDRLAIMARRPCRVQAAWLGYPGTTGAAFIDYLIADPVIVPPELEGAYSERVVRLPHCYQPNDRKREVAATASRGDYGLPDDAFVFCCFNQANKISPELFAAWMRLLGAVPGGVLWLLEGHSLAGANLVAAARAHGMAPERIVLAPKLANARHLARYRAADLALDTFPYTSHTTLSDALWCGCPAIALAGETFAARVSGSILTAAGLPDLVTRSLEEYAALAAALATQPARLDSIRARVAHAREHSALFDTEALTRALEAIYLRITG
ncbi:MAG: tetratricopeptide repeat protein [Burkholderiales bacterium]|nr:tetratricopeptide repeat protein [Burkholderiales bacterium]